MMDVFPVVVFNNTLSGVIYHSPGGNQSQTPSGDHVSNDSQVSVNMTDMGSMPVYMQSIVIVMYSMITLVAVGGNITVCYIVLGYQRMRTVTNYFIFNLACSDMLMSVLCVPFTFVTSVLIHYWPFGAAMCPIVPLAQSVTVFLSAFTLVAISIDRYRAIIYPLKPRMTTKQAYRIIILIWLLSLAVSLPTAVLSRIQQRHDMTGQMRNHCEEMWPNPNQRYMYTLTIMVLQYFLPLSVLLFTYSWIGFVIWVKKPPGEAEDSRDQRMAASKRKMVKMMITVVIVYGICWLPLHVITLVGDAHPDIWSFRYIQPIWVMCHWLAMSNCCYNPLVYCWMNSRFRCGFRYVFRYCPCAQYDEHLHGPHRQQVVSTFQSTKSTTHAVVSVDNKRTYGVYNTTLVTTKPTVTHSTAIPTSVVQHLSSTETEAAEQLPLTHSPSNGYCSKNNRGGSSSPWSTP